MSLIPEPPPPPVAVVLYEISSTVSPTNAPTPNTTDVPFVAVKSVDFNFDPLTNTSKNPTL